MVNGEICIGLFALRDIKKVYLLFPFATFVFIYLLFTDSWIFILLTESLTE